MDLTSKIAKEIDDARMKYQTRGINIDDEYSKCMNCDSRPYVAGQEPDPCIGFFPGVVSSCCGHGGTGYLIFEDGTKIIFKEIINE
jgi:hypothetical protein